MLEEQQTLYCSFLVRLCFFFRFFCFFSFLYVSPIFWTLGSIQKESVLCYPFLYILYYIGVEFITTVKTGG